MSYDPTRIIMIKGQVSKVLCAFGILTVGGNQTLITGVSGAIYRVMGLIAQSDAAPQGYFRLKTGTSQIMAYITAPPSTAPPFLLPIVETGYWETNSGDALGIDVSANTIDISVFYIAYKP